LKHAVHVKNKIIQGLDSVNHSLDPVRLLKQIQFLQDALWKHVTFAKHISPSKNADTQPLYGFTLGSTPKESTEESNNDSLILKPAIIRRRQYRKTKKPRVKHWWRTRKDPLENVWDEVCSWLVDNPERTATSILLKLQKKYPGQYSEGQLRTLQRRVKSWREKSIIMYDDNWVKDEALAEGTKIGDLKAITVDRPENLKEAFLAV